MLSLIDLPIDIQNTIVDSLNLPRFLFAPADGPLDDKSHMGASVSKTQHDQYYGGSSNTEDVVAAFALLHWSSTCSFYRRLFESRIFRDVLLRTRERSLRSVEAISSTKLWDRVQSLTLRSSSDHYRHSYGPADLIGGIRVSRMPKYTWLGDIMEPLLTLLTRLPPNMTTLTLDFMWDWQEEIGRGCYMPTISQHFMGFLQRVARALGKNDLSERQPFTLNLVNIPSGKMSWEAHKESSSELPDFFSNVMQHGIDVSISLCHVGASNGWYPRPIFELPSSKETLGSKLLTHLNKVRRLRIDASPCCGISDNSLSLEKRECGQIPLPTATTHLSNLTDLTLSAFPLGHQMIQLVTTHATILQSLCLAECMDVGGFPRTWASFFKQLNSGAPNLRHLTLKYNRSDFKLLTSPDWQATGQHYPYVDEAYQCLLEQDSSRATISEDDWARRKRVLPYLWEVGDTPWATLWRGASETARQFLEGGDYQALNELRAVLEGRGGGVMHLPP